MLLLWVSSVASLCRSNWQEFFNISKVLPNFWTFSKLKSVLALPVWSILIFYRVYKEHLSSNSTVGCLGLTTRLNDKCKTPVMIVKRCLYYFSSVQSSFLLHYCRYKEKGNTGMSIMDIGILTGFAPDIKSLKKVNILLLYLHRILDLLLASFTWYLFLGGPFLPGNRTRVHEYSI